MTIGSRIKSLRMENGLSQDELAKKIGVSQSLVNQWEMGKTPVSKKKRPRIAQIFMIPVEELEGEINLDHFDSEVSRWLQDKENKKMIDDVTKLYFNSRKNRYNQ